MKGLTPQTREGKDPRDMRVYLAGSPKVGKSTLASNWAPQSTLIVDTHRGTIHLDGEHYVQHVKTWAEFVAFVDKVCTSPPEGLRTIVIDLIEHIYDFANRHVADKGNVVSASQIKWGEGRDELEMLFKREIGRLFSTSFGVWFVSHTDTVENDKVMMHVPSLHKRVIKFVEGACDYIFLAEAFGPTRLLHTAPSAKFQAGGRTKLPDPMELNAKVLYQAMDVSLNPDQKTSR